MAVLGALWLVLGTVAIIICIILFEGGTIACQVYSLNRKIIYAA